MKVHMKKMKSSKQKNKRDKYGFRKLKNANFVLFLHPRKNRNKKDWKLHVVKLCHSILPFFSLPLHCIAKEICFKNQFNKQPIHVHERQSLSQLQKIS
jgi:hypothetical protein